VSRELKLVKRVVLLRDSEVRMRELSEWLDAETAHLAGRKNYLENLLCFLE
jgi:hypothetical protein